MTLKTTKLRDAIAFAIVVSAASAMGTGTALAQDATPTDDASTLDVVVVTGTRIQSQTVTAASPVTEIQSEEFQYTGATRTEDLINQYPQLSPSFDSFQNNGAFGYPTVNLRGLGSSRTLVLVNGNRLPLGEFEARDISIVPAAAIRRTDILTGGASAVYGSDAIAGVVNFILDDEFEGVSLEFGWSAYQHDNDNEYIQQLLGARNFDFPTGDSGFDGVSTNVDMVVGSSFADGRGHAMAWATYRENDALFQGERDYSSCALNAAGNACGGSATNATGNFYAYQFDPRFAGGFFGTSASVNQTTGRFINAYGAPYNYAPINYYQRPDERYTFGSVLKYEVNEHFRPYLETMFINRTSSIQVAESGAFFVPVTVPCDNPRIGTLCSDLGFFQDAGADDVTVYVAKRNVEGGPRRTDTETTQYRIVAGVEGNLDDNWAYNSSFLYGRTEADTFGFNDFLTSRIQSAILGCPDGSFAGCIPYNVFTPGGVTPEAAASLAGVSARKVETEITGVNAYVTGNIGIGLPFVEDGDIDVVFGAEWREETYYLTADTNSQEGNFAGSGGPTVPVSGEISVAEVFAEAAVPLLRDAGFIREATLDLGYRLSDYDRSGRANTWKVGLTADMGAFRVRTSYNHAIRAPNITDLFSPNQIALTGINDPCAGATPTLSAQQCVLTGVPLNRYGTVAQNPAGQLNQFIGGNLDLDPEVSDTFTFGVVVQPFQNFTLNADYFHIEIEETIATIGTSTIINQCAATGQASLCSRIRRNPVTLDLFRGSDPNTSGYIFNLTDNFGEVEYRGIDVGANYRWEMVGGRFFAGLNGTYLMEEEWRPLPGVEAANYDCAGVVNPSCGTVFSWRHIAFLRYSRDFFSVNARWRYFGEVDYANDSGPLTTDKLLCSGATGCKGDGGIGAQSFLDLSATLYPGENTEITFGVNNVMDKEPPLVGNTLATNGNAPGAYDQAGRYVFASIGFRF